MRARSFTRPFTRLAGALVIAGLGLAIAAQPAAAFYGSFWASCGGVRIYGNGAYMTAYCRRFDGSWRFSRIYHCGGAGVRNVDGHLVCGTD